MPVRELLEKYPLYRRVKHGVNYLKFDSIPKPAIHMRCATCKSDQTFNMVNEYYEARRVTNEDARGKVCRLVYACMSCSEGRRFFVVWFDGDGETVMKVGQLPSWEIHPEKDLELMLGGHAELYKRALVCESQGYGIGAFGYYRRIVEDIIGRLLDDVAELLAGPEKDVYVKVLERVRATNVAQEKIALVKDVLPATLRPAGVNPLGVLHETLSEGLHEASDEVCMELSAAIRESLVFLVDQVSATQKRRKGFSEGMRMLLERKAKKGVRKAGE